MGCVVGSDKLRAQTLYFTTCGRSASSSWNSWAPVTKKFLGGYGKLVGKLNTRPSFVFVWNKSTIKTTRWNCDHKQKLISDVCWCLNYSKMGLSCELACSSCSLGAASCPLRWEEQPSKSGAAVGSWERDLLPPLGVLQSDHRYNSNQTSYHTSNQTSTTTNSWYQEFTCKDPRRPRKSGMAPW